MLVITPSQLVEHVAVVLAGWLLEELRHRLLACPRKDDAERLTDAFAPLVLGNAAASLHVKAKLSKVSMAKKLAR